VRAGVHRLARRREAWLNWVAMNRTYAAIVLASAVALPLGACGGDDNGAAYDYGPASICPRYHTCGECTPVLGCGWCFNARGGICVTDPNQCAVQVSEFTWTWDPSGCPDVDASVAPVDAGPAHKDASPQPSEAGEQ
jgi:Plexin repeat